MEFFKHATTIDFMRHKMAAAFFSLAIFVVSIVGLCVNGLNLGLDFRGGTQIELHFDKSIVPGTVREALGPFELGELQVQSYGSSQDVLIKLAPAEGVTQDQIKQVIDQTLQGSTIVQAEYIGPQVGKELINKGIMALLMCVLVTMAYIAIRFEYRFAVSAAVALIHDPVMILGVFAWWQIEFNLISLAALLTILGYSLNDTIVVYDRVRENFRKLRRARVAEVMNVSINQTLSRTIMTSGLTLLVVLALLCFGGEVLFGFSLSLALGIVIGTYSSIFVAGALAVVMGLNRTHLLPRARAPIDDLP